VVFGVYVGVWAVAAVDIERDLGLSHAGFGLVNSLAVAGAAAANAIGGSLTERLGTRRVLAVAFAVWGGLLVAAAAIRTPLAFGALLVLVVSLSGLLDVAMNVAATAALAERPGALVRFHALFNAGAALGAALTGLLVASDIVWRWAWVVGAGLAVITAVACWRTPLPAGERGEHLALSSVIGLLRREALLLVAAAFAAGAMVETGINLWGVLYLRTHLSSGAAVGALSAVGAAVVAGVARVTLGPTVGRRSARTGVTTGAGLAVAGLLVLAYAPQPWLAGLGLVVAAAGISMYWPLLLAHASAASPRPGAVIGAMSGAGYLGIVAGPAIVGWVASQVGLRGGLIFLAAAAAFVAISPSRRAPVTSVSA
jgi:MFS family permease